MKTYGKKLVRTVLGHKVVVQAWRDNDADEFALADFSIGQAFAGSSDDDLAAHGTVRWDGCINWGDGGGTANHFCDPAALDAWALAMRAVWDMAAEVIDMEPTPIACSMTVDDVARRPEDDDEPDCGKCSQNRGDPGPACQQCVAGDGDSDWLGEDWFEAGDGAIRPKNCENCRFLVGEPPTPHGAGQCGCPRNLSGKAVVGQDCHLWEPKGDTRPPSMVLCPDCAGAPLDASEPFSQASAAVCPTCCGEGKVDRAVANAFEQGRASFGHARTAGDDVDVTVRVRRANLPSLIEGIVLGIDLYGRKPIRLRLKSVMGEADTFTIEVETNTMVALEAVPEPANVEPVED